jgi:hypothetical protein
MLQCRMYAPASMMLQPPASASADSMQHTSMRQPKPSRLDTTRDGQWLTLTKGPPLLPSRDFVKRHLKEQSM